MDALPVKGANIFISDLRLQARVGVNPGEEGAEQPIALDIWVGLEDIELPARSERLSDTMDYVAVARTVRRVVEERHYPLVESLATAIAQALLARPGATWVRVKLQKLRCLRHASAAGVEIELGLEHLEDLPVPLAADRINDTEEVIILGGGAAGLAASLWCWRLGHPALLVDPSALLGGQLHLVHGAMPDIPGMNPVSGIALARHLWRQFAAHGGRWLQAKLQRVERDERGCLLTIRGQEPDGTSWERLLRGRITIVATGVRRRGLDIPGEKELMGRGILATAAKGASDLPGKRVAVVGGGDSACENALLLARSGARVLLIHRGDGLSARRQFSVEVTRTPRIEVRLSTCIRRFFGGEALEGIEIKREGSRETLSIDAALVRVGWIPNSEGLPDAWLNPEGYVRADGSGRIQGETHYFAAGDILGRIVPSVATSFGSGATAARAAVFQLEEVPHGDARRSERPIDGSGS